MGKDVSSSLSIQNNHCAVIKILFCIMVSLSFVLLVHRLYCS